jgi:glutathione S-transferase
MSMKLYGNPFSTCTRKVLATLAEKNHQAEFVVIDFAKNEQKSAEHLARQPFGVVPYIEDGNFTMYESRAIIRYLDAKLPGVSLTPQKLEDRARMEQWISVEASYFSSAAMKIVMQTFFGRMRGKEPDMKIVEAGRAELGKVADIVDKHLAGKQFFAGEMFSLADICFMPYVEYLFPAESGDIVTSRSNLSAWWNRVSARPSWLKATGKNASA